MARDATVGPFDVYRREKERWQEAADIETGGNLAEFVRQTVRREAERVLREHEYRRLNERQGAGGDA